MAQLGSDDFIWRGPGGGKLLAHFISSGLYCTGDNIDYDEVIQIPGAHLGVADGATGFLVRDTDGAVEAVNRISEIDRQDCRRHFERYFTDERMALDYVKIYRRLVGADSSPLAIDDGALNWIDLTSPSSTT